MGTSISASVIKSPEKFFCGTVARLTKERAGAQSRLCLSHHSMPALCWNRFKMGSLPLLNARKCWKRGLNSLNSLAENLCHRKASIRRQKKIWPCSGKIHGALGKEKGFIVFLHFLSFNFHHHSRNQTDHSHQSSLNMIFKIILIILLTILTTLKNITAIIMAIVIILIMIMITMAS